MMVPDISARPARTLVRDASRVTVQSSGLLPPIKQAGSPISMASQYSKEPSAKKKKKKNKVSYKSQQLAQELNQLDEESTVVQDYGAPPDRSESLEKLRIKDKKRNRKLSPNGLPVYETVGVSPKLSVHSGVRRRVKDDLHSRYNKLVKTSDSTINAYISNIERTPSKE